MPVHREDDFQRPATSRSSHPEDDNVLMPLFRDPEIAHNDGAKACRGSELSWGRR